MKLPWAKVVVGCNGKLTMVHYKVCNNIGGRKNLLVLKFDSFQKHTRMRKCKVIHIECVVGQYFMSIESQHVKNKHKVFQERSKFCCRHGVCWRFG